MGRIAGFEPTLADKSGVIPLYYMRLYLVCVPLRDQRFNTAMPNTLYPVFL